ncbi:MAG: site-2 protease family protein [Candidatus Levybacteria bacterium]|nr:site-2 protease family protein [Candidatus Levybacteria bacterium]MBP9815055.1 site-2 protease family protein [Candidatus Levybacteria bacterium]
MILTIFAFIIILSVLVLIHELGHFLTAKKFGIKVEEFGFGFPPRVFGIKKGETLYSINLLPVGGFVKLYGEDAAGGGSVKNTGKKDLPTKDIRRAFYARPVWQRFLVVVAGVVMNFVLAVVLISYVFSTTGIAVPSSTVKITEVLKNSPAALSGLMVGDVVGAVNGKSTTSTKEFIQTIKKNEGKKVTLLVVREGVSQDIQLTPRSNYPKGQGPVGVGITDIEIKKYPWYQAPFFGTIEAFKFSWMIVSGLGQMIYTLFFEGHKPEGVAGPIGVAQLTGQAVSSGVTVTLWFTALLSINLAVLNVLPIPALDGGRLFFIVTEAVTRRKINPKYESYAHAAGLVVLLGLMLIITLFDIIRIASGQSLLPK